MPNVQSCSHQAAFSTIHLTYYQYLIAPPVNTPETGFLIRVANAFRDGGSIPGTLFLAMVSIWPLLAGIVAAWYLVKRYQSGNIKTVK